MRVRRLGLLVFALCLTGVTIGGASSEGTPSAGGPNQGAPSATEYGARVGPCVTDAGTVIGRPPTPASTTNELPSSLVSTLDAVAQASFTRAATSGALVGVRTPQGTWTAAYGLADPTIPHAMTTDAYMRIGSVTKTVTGTVLLQLAQDGLLSRRDTIDRYYPGIPNGDRITLEQLATMTSGIADYDTDAFRNQYFSHPETIFTPDQLIAYAASASPIFEPGATFGYSNTNTVLLGLVIEKVTGKSAPDVFAERVYAPLGLTHTSLPTGSPEIPTPHPQGYTLQGSATPANPANATHWSPSFAWTAGGMISTLADLLTYGRALATGQGLVSAQTQAERLTSFPSPAGYGFALDCRDGWVGHAGELPGFSAALYHDTTSDTSVVVLVNSDIAAGDCPVSPTLTEKALTDNQTDLPGCSPATRVFIALTEALGHPLPSK